MEGVRLAERASSKAAGVPENIILALRREKTPQFVDKGRLLKASFRRLPNLLMGALKLLTI